MSISAIQLPGRGEQLHQRIRRWPRVPQAYGGRSPSRSACRSRSAARPGGSPRVTRITMSRSSRSGSGSACLFCAAETQPRPRSTVRSVSGSPAVQRGDVRPRPAPRRRAMSWQSGPVLLTQVHRTGSSAGGRPALQVQMMSMTSSVTRNGGELGAPSIRYWSPPHRDRGQRAFSGPSSRQWNRPAVDPNDAYPISVGPGRWAISMTFLSAMPSYNYRDYADPLAAVICRGRYFESYPAISRAWRRLIASMTRSSAPVSSPGSLT